MNFKPLIAEKDANGEFKDISLGRITFWIVFGIAVYVWLFGTGDIQASHMQMLYIATTYNLMKKTSWFGGKMTTQATPTDTTITTEYETEDRPPRLRE